MITDDFNWFVMVASAGILSFLFGFPIRTVLKRYQIIDRPNERSSHKTFVVRGGGIGILIAFGLVAVWVVLGTPHFGVWLALLSAAVALALVSLWDDMRTVSWKIRLATHLLASGGTVAAVVWFGGCRDGDGFGMWLQFCVGLVVVVGYINAFNFMDGINGLASGQACVTALGTVLIARANGVGEVDPLLGILGAVGGAAGGFLPHNFPRARMFMGDVGSVPLGFVLALCSFFLAAKYGWSLLLAFGLLHANFLLDTSLTLFRRLLHGQRIQDAHRDHFYQRLVRAGFSHTAVTGMEIAVQILVAGVLMMYFAEGIHGKLICAGAVLVSWTLFFVFAECRLCTAARSGPR